MNFASQRGECIRIHESWLAWALHVLPAVLPQIRYLDGEVCYTIRHGEVSVWARALWSGTELRRTELERGLVHDIGPLPKDPALRREFRDRAVARVLERDEIYRSTWQLAELFEHADANSLWVEYTEDG